MVGVRRRPRCDTGGQGGAPSSTASARGVRPALPRNRPSRAHTPHADPAPRRTHTDPAASLAGPTDGCLVTPRLLEGRRLHTRVNYDLARYAYSGKRRKHAKKNRHGKSHAATLPSPRTRQNSVTRVISQVSVRQLVSRSIFTSVPLRTCRFTERILILTT